MDAEHNGLTLEQLAQRLEALQRENAQRLEALERENERMRSENTELRSKVATLEGSDTPRNGLAETGSLVPRRAEEGVSGSEGRLSRKALLGKAGAAAAAAMAAGMLLNPREASAENFAEVFAGYIGVYSNKPHDPYGRIALHVGTDSAADPAGFFQNPRGDAIVGDTKGNAKSGVYGVHTGLETSGFGVTGDGRGRSGAGVVGRNPTGDGVVGSTRGNGVSGVYGVHTGTSGFGVTGDGKGFNGAGVLGRNPTGDGVRGEGINGVHGKATAGGTGVFGEGANGYAGTFSGGKAQLRIVPKAGVGRPTSGSFGKGDVYMDSQANLFVCVAGTTSSSAALWRQVSTVAVS